MCGITEAVTNLKERELSNIMVEVNALGTLEEVRVHHVLLMPLLVIHSHVAGTLSNQQTTSPACVFLSYLIYPEVWLTVGA